MPSKNIPVNGWPQIKELDIVAPILAELDKIETWQKSVKQETKTGAEVTFTNALALDALSVSAVINPIQDLHGYDKPWTDGTGKNKLKITTTTSTINGVTFTVNEDGSITVNGTSTANNTFFNLNYTANTVKIPFGVSVEIGANVISPNSDLNIQCATDVDGVVKAVGALASFVKGVSFTIEQGGNTATWMRLQIPYAGTTINNTTIYPFWCYASDTLNAWEPYSNICPISGHTSVTITDIDAESQTATVIVQLDSTVYGGTLNVTTGVLTLTHSFATFNGDESENWVLGGESHKYFRCDDITDAKATAEQSDIGDILSNEFPSLAFTGVYGGNYGVAVNTNGKIYVFVNDDVNTVALFKSWLSSNNLQIRYELATPATVELTPTQLQMLAGYNKLSADTGNITVTAYTGNKWN